MSRLLLGALATAGAGLAWAVAETRMFTVRTHDLAVLPPGSRPVRLLHVSDLHLTPTQRLKREWVRSLATLEPDLVITTGDNLAHRGAVPAALDALGPLLGLPGAFVLGSNDYYAPVMKNPARYLLPSSRRSRASAAARTLPTDELVSGLTRAGWLDLTNARGELTVHDMRISLVGVDDPHLERDDFPPASTRPRAALHLGLTHAPYTRALDRLTGDGADLILAGHTHGGQLRVPGYGALVTNCDLDTGRARGLHGWPGARPDTPGGQHSTWLNVSAGLGTSPVTPVRFACRPEVSLIELLPR